MTTIIPKHLNKSLSVHTFTYFYKCSDKTYYGLFQYLAEKPDCNFKKHRKKKCTKYVTRSFHSLGFNRIEFVDCMIPNQDYHVYKIKFTVNPRILIGETKNLRTRIIDKDYLTQLPDILDNAICEITGPFKNQLVHGKFQRIDYCLNFWLNSQETAEEYMRLLKKALIPYPFELKKILNSTQHRYVPESHAITLTCKSYELSLYLKLPQLIEEINNLENDTIPPEYAPELANARGQLRIELREYRCQLRNNKKKLHCGSDESHFLNGLNTLPFTTLCQRLKSMYGTGDFYLYEDAKDIINQSGYGKKIKKELLEILKVVNTKKRGLDTAANGFEYNYLKSHMRYFNELDLCPITISKKSYKRCGEDFFPNPLKYITGDNNELLLDSDI